MRAGLDDVGIDINAARDSNLINGAFAGAVGPGENYHLRFFAIRIISNSLHILYVRLDIPNKLVWFPHRSRQSAPF